MRHLSVVFVFLAGAGVVVANDDAEEQARTEITKAIKATGLEGRPIPKAFRWKTKFSIDILDKNLEWQEVKVAKTLTIAFPFQFKEVDDYTVRGETKAMTLIFDGKKGWGEFDGKVNALEEAGFRDAHEMSNYVEATHYLTPLLDKKKYQLKSIGMTFVEGRRANEIHVSREGYRDMKLFFDYKTHLLVKTERISNDQRTGAEVTEYRVFRSHQKVNGRMIPAIVAVFIHEELVQEQHLVDYTELNIVDANEFAAPKERQ